MPEERAEFGLADHRRARIKHHPPKPGGANDRSGKPVMTLQMSRRKTAVVGSPVLIGQGSRFGVIPRIYAVVAW